MNTDSVFNKHCIMLSLPPVDEQVSGADPGFPQGRRQLPSWAPTYDFAKFSRKLHEIKRIWGSFSLMGRQTNKVPVDVRPNRGFPKLKLSRIELIEQI